MIDTLAQELMRPFGTLPLGLAVLRLLAAALCGGLIGTERIAHGKSAGPRTHIMIAMSSALFTIVGMTFGAASFGPDVHVQIDPTRLTQSVTAGVAFLAAGVIFLTGGRVHNLTTGAEMWMSGAIGLACGAGQITLALVATGLVIMVMVPVRRLEKRILPKNGATDESDD